MCFDDRKTDSRGRSLAVRRSFARTRCRRRRKRALALSDIGLFLLAFLPADGFGCVFDALALVGFGPPVGPYLGGDLADALAVSAAHRDDGWPLAGDLDVLGDRKRDIVTVAELQIESVALNCCAVADTADLKGD